MNVILFTLGNEYLFTSRNAHATTEANFINSNLQRNSPFRIELNLKVLNVKLNLKSKHSKSEIRHITEIEAANSASDYNTLPDKFRERHVLVYKKFMDLKNY